MGFGGADLTVRPRGHVPPENVKRDLPHTHGALASKGIGLPMVTTGLLSRNDPAARPTLCTAARLGIPRFKIGCCRNRGFDDRAGHLARIKADVEGQDVPAGTGHGGLPEVLPDACRKRLCRPISPHVEYGIEAPTEAQRIDRTMQAIETDFRYLRSQFKAEFG